MNIKSNTQWDSLIKHYKKTDERALAFRDLILQDIQKLNKDNNLVVLDIGCGEGIDGNYDIQKSFASYSREYIGIEPDESIKLGNFFTSYYNTNLQNTPIKENHVDIAFAFMVLEHIKYPYSFWNKLYKILRKGGIFWAYTIDARHWFAKASKVSDKLNIKDKYLDVLHGKRKIDRYENYKIHYRSNKPKQIYDLTKQFSETEIISFFQDDSVDYYFPRKVQWIGRFLNFLFYYFGIATSSMAIRVKK